MDTTPNSPKKKQPEKLQKEEGGNSPEGGTREDVLRRFQEAYSNYMRALQEVWVREDAQKGFQEAYGNYVRALLEAWAQVDVNILDLSSLAAISQSMMAAALMTAASNAAIGQQWLTTASYLPVLQQLTMR